jgi:hypothetical protein
MPSDEIKKALAALKRQWRAITRAIEALERVESVYRPRPAPRAAAPLKIVEKPLRKAGK